MYITESLQMAWRTLSANRLRSFLTVLGIIIGNASIIAMIGVGQGAQSYARGQFQALGTNVLTVMRSFNMNRSTGAPRNTLTLADADAIGAQVPTVVAVAPSLNANETITYGSKLAQATVTGTQPGFVTVRNFPVAQGRFFTDPEVKREARVVVLGANLATSLFGNASPLGATVRMHKASFEVIGVLTAKGATAGPGGNQDDAAYMPITTVANRLVGRNSSFGIGVNNIAVTARNQESMDAAQFQITNLLRRRHRLTGEDDFQVRNQQDALQAADNIAGALTMLLTATAAISLLVGGIGIMNIMLVSVTERTQEIGLRKAIGATEGDVLTQFLIEAIILSLAGGALGTVVGGGATVLIRALTPLQAGVAPWAVGLAVGVSGAIGLGFGVVPARRAARLDPIVALRST